MSRNCAFGFKPLSVCIGRERRNPCKSCLHRAVVEPLCETTRYR
jgi:hypothetical protein